MLLILMETPPPLQATEEKAKVEAEAAACLTRLSLAERLVGGLSSENERWGNEIEKLRNSATTLVGDCMLASGFVSYVGAFDQANRDILWKGVWTPGETGGTRRLKACLNAVRLSLMYVTSPTPKVALCRPCRMW